MSRSPDFLLGQRAATGALAEMPVGSLDGKRPAREACKEYTQLNVKRILTIDAAPSFPKAGTEPPTDESVKQSNQLASQNA